VSGPAGVGKKGTESSSYRDYVLREWEHFHNDPAASRATAEALGGAPARSVLDVGCGAGQELLLFAKRDSFTVGIDVSPEVGTFALGPEYDRLTFVRASGERIPFTSASFDIVICRIALPYMNNAQALAEIARVLVPGGLLVLQVHAMWYYVEKLGKGFLDRDAQGMRYAWRVLANGIRYNLTGTQRRYPVRGETFQTKWMLKRELRRVGLEVVRELPRLKHAAPGFLIRKAR
jgi:ubiquinone/menaquinone biosynthesis C-methylase UbiE